MARLGRSYPVRRVFAPRFVTVSFDAVGAGAGSVTGSTISWSHTSTGNAVVVFHCVYSTYTGSGTATYGSQSLSFLGTSGAFYSSSGYTARINVYGLLNPAAGAQTVTITHPSAWLSNDSAGNSVSYRNVGGFGSVVANSATGTSMSVGAPSAMKQIVAQAFGSSFSPTISGYNQTSRWLHQSVSGDQPMQIGDAPGAPSLNFTATLSSSQGWGAAAVPLVPAS